MNTTNSSAIATDEFCQDSFIDKNISLPTVIVLNHGVRCGYYIPLQTMAKIDWVNFDDSQLVEHTFRSQSTEMGVLIKNPRMLCIAKTELYQFDKDESEKQKSKVVIGLYNPELKGDRNIKTERLYLVYFLDENNNFLHTLPLKYAARGVNGATFELHRQAFRSELEACHAIANKVPARPKNDRFHALGVFSFQTKAELVGEKNNSSWVCRVVAHDKPIIDNWESHFLGYTEHKDYIWSSLEPESAITVPGLPQLTSAPINTSATEKVSISASEYLLPDDDDDILY